MMSHNTDGRGLLSVHNSLFIICVFTWTLNDIDQTAPTVLYIKDTGLLQ